MDHQTQQAILAKTMEIAVEKILEAENQLDEAIEHYDNMSQDEIADLRSRRRQQLQETNKKKIVCLHHQLLCPPPINRQYYSHRIG